MKLDFIQSKNNETMKKSLIESNLLSILFFLIFSLLSSCSKNTSTVTPTANSKLIKTIKIYNRTQSYFYKNGNYLDSIVYSNSYDTSFKLVKKFTYSANLITRVVSYNIFKNIKDTTSIKEKNYYYQNDSLLYEFDGYVFTYQKGNITSITYLNYPAVQYEYDNYENPFNLIVGYTKILGLDLEIDNYENKSYNNVTKTINGSNVKNINISYNNLNMPYQIIINNNSNNPINIEYY